MEKKQTAVEWLEKNIDLRMDVFELIELLDKAKQMEKQQIMKAVYDSMGTNFDPNMGRAEQYFNEMYVSTTQPRMNEDYKFEDGV
jgi:hypothetical protein